MAKKRTSRGKLFDMAALISKHEHTRAVSNLDVNARGDAIDQQGRVVQSAATRVSNAYQDTVRTSGAIEGISQSANPNAPLSPKQLREVAELSSGVIEEKVKEKPKTAHPLLDEVAKKVPLVKVPSKPAAEAPDTFAPTEELHSEEAALAAELEDDLDIEAIKAACLDNTVSTPETTKQPTNKGK